MKVQVPDEVKASVPQNSWGKILSTTPVVMAVLATLLAGLASSEMTRAQYDRSLAAQQQSKAGDQWSFYQAKKVRGALQRNSADLLGELASVHAIDEATVRSVVGRVDPVGDGIAAKGDLLATLDTPAGRTAIDLIAHGRAPDAEVAAAGDADLAHALTAIAEQHPEDEVTKALEKLSDATVVQGLATARHRAQAFDEAAKPINAAVERIGLQIARLESSMPADAASSSPWLSSLKRDYAAAQFVYAARRYETEARLNQDIAAIYEVEVRRSNRSAERHHQRSQSFFFGMLGAQLGVIISTVALAARQRNILWSIAAGAGLVAITFAGYVYAFT